MHSRSLIILVAACFVAGTANAQALPDLLAHDINGIATGMTVADAQRVLHAIPKQEDQKTFTFKTGASKYMMRVTSEGRIYEIAYTQDLGSDPSQAVMAAILPKLVAKYGPYRSRSQVGANWEVRRGTSRSYVIIRSLEASVGTTPYGLRMDMIDYEVSSGAARGDTSAKAAASARF